jgi:serine/threonine protein kinase
MTLAIGTRLGAYEVVRAIGAGGMGEIHKARDTRLDRTVAIKILPESLAADPQFQERFDREARAISRLDHPHICALYDLGEQDGRAYLVMQYLEGETLAARLVATRTPADARTDDALRTLVRLLARQAARDVFENRLVVRTQSIVLVSRSLESRHLRSLLLG